MKKLLKIPTIILLAILTLGVVVIMAINLFADRAVKMGIETAATKTLKVSVTVDNVDLSIMAGKLALQNLVIKNPPGYQHSDLLKLRDAVIQVDVGSLLGDVVNIKEIKLDGAEVTIEQRSISGNNLQDVIKGIPKTSTGGGESQPAGKKLHIDNLELSNITVKVKMLPVPGKADTVTLKLAPIKMTDLGGDNKLDIAALSSKVLLAIAQGVAEQGVGIVPNEILNPLKSPMGETIEIGKGIIEGTKDIGKDITEGLKGLLKPKKNE